MSALVSPNPLASRPSRAASATFLITHAAWPALIFLAAFAWLELLHGDFWWADRLYAWSGHAWTLQNHWLTETVLHVGGRALSALAWLAVLCAWLAASLRPQWHGARRPLLFLLLSVATTTLLVGLLKSFTNMDCPWDLVGYGGDRPFVGLFQARPSWLPHAACFPAGHASGGYAWVALYFFARATTPQWRRLGLAAGLALGLAFGLAQQLRGAHFLSHDVATLAIAWFTALGLYHLFRLADRVPAPARASSAPRVLASAPVQS